MIMKLITLIEKHKVVAVSAINKFYNLNVRKDHILIYPISIHNRPPTPNHIWIQNPIFHSLKKNLNTMVASWFNLRTVKMVLKHHLQGTIGKNIRVFLKKLDKMSSFI